MAKLVSFDAASSFELTPLHASRAAGDIADDDAVLCRVQFEAYGEPVEGRIQLTRGGIARLLQRLRMFCEKRSGMLQLRDETQSLELSLAAKRSRWTEKIRVTGLAGVPQAAQPEVADELRAGVGILLRQDNGTASVEHRGGLVAKFEDLLRFARELEAEASGAIEPTGSSA
ncbi:MAG: hypothetical protein IPP14_14835 [Planctomycetes bacterium]|nr:hypothetical protein [Planctomycetota bacterium]